MVFLTTYVAIYVLTKNRIVCKGVQLFAALVVQNGSH